MANIDREERAIRTLRSYESFYRRSVNAPLFLFLCGGDDANPSYICRKHVEEYVATSPSLKRVLTVKPEILLNGYSDVINDVNLLELEALIADLSDAILLFDESPGSLCELGAFAMSTPIREIMTACVPGRYRDEKSFVIQGPIRQIEQNQTEMSRVIYLDTDCPFASAGLLEYFSSFEKRVDAAAKRKMNRDSDAVDFGTFCRECLDLVAIFSPLTDRKLLEIYKRYKRFDTFKFRIKSLGKPPRGMTYKIALAYLASTGLIAYDYQSGELDMTGDAPGYFMFGPDRRKQVQSVRAELLSFKRKSHKEIDSVCR
ncbi:retron St85 family effector protein [Adlercreutzia shanghongiae]|uniref:Retron St85 family effector protein n=1 Tax=Adlercreutzia shanghongiae TaxID=3111773 RepID=A0ABU6J0U1_9ACTN|nr:retron St85 family effector protein [Adlercreutzia sp. R22]MEC4295664.1 retron St85 family effector protein [Adlercreutzia sp. R22]